MNHVPLQRIASCHVFFEGVISEPSLALRVVPPAGSEEETQGQQLQSNNHRQPPPL